MSLKQDLALLSLSLDVEKGHQLGASRRTILALSLTNEEAKQCVRLVRDRLAAEGQPANELAALRKMTNYLRYSEDKLEFFGKCRGDGQREPLDLSSKPTHADRVATAASQKAAHEGQTEKFVGDPSASIDWERDYSL